MSTVTGKPEDVEAFRKETTTQGSASSSVPMSTERKTLPSDTATSDLHPLDRTALRDGYRLCIANARRLISDARALESADRHASARLLLLLALEELGSAIQLYEAGRVGVHDWEGWWRQYFRRNNVLESKSLGIAKPNEQTPPVTEELTYVNFDKKQMKFRAPREDSDSDRFVKKTAYTESVLKALPLYAFELQEFQQMLMQPETTPSVLYARIEELVSQDPGVSEKDLLNEIARGSGRSPEQFTAAFEQWRKLAPKARAYVDLLERVQDRMKKQQETS